MQRKGSRRMNCSPTTSESKPIQYQRTSKHAPYDTTPIRMGFDRMKS